MREIFNMNLGWKFYYGDIEEQNFNSVHKESFNKPQWLKAGNNGLAMWGYNDSEWKDVNLPHDFVNDYCEFSPEYTPRQGCLVTDKAWYRKSFYLSHEDEGKTIQIEFDGVFRDCTVWFNGHFIGRNLSGYTSFSFDLSDFINYGKENVIAVYVNPTEYEGWWYEGGGIYRDVRLVKTNRLHIPQWGTFIKSNIIKDEKNQKANLTIETTIANQYENQVSFDICTQIIDKDGNLLTELTSNSSAKSNKRIDIVQQTTMNDPQLWSIENPYLYKAITVLKIEGNVVDRYETPFGVRTIKFDSEKGFFLNEKPIKLQGVCCHEDHAGVGTGLPASLHEHRIKRLKDMGCNAYRSSHNHPSPAILEACDRLGMLVIDETRLMSSSEEYKEQLKSLILRDRNHPSIILWSLGNEEMVIQGTFIGVRILKSLQQFVHELDPTRKCTYAMNGEWDKYTDFHEEKGFTLDVKGFNYNLMRNFDSYDHFHQKYPTLPFFGSENASTLTTRGLYKENEEEKALVLSKQGSEVCIWSNDKRKGIVTAYGETYPVWGSTPDETWKLVANRPYVAGAFIWTGFDYRGETFPFEWPSVVARYGIMDLCGFAKDHYYYYQAWWTKEPVLHVFPHWNWEGKEGETIDVRVYSNMDEIELFVNGSSCGRKVMPEHEHVQWEVPYQPGEVVAIGYKDGTALIVKKIETTGKPTKIILTPNRDKIYADHDDVCVVDVKITDEYGRLVPNQDCIVDFTVEGEGKLIGVGNGNPLSHEHDKEPQRKTFHGMCQAIIQSTNNSGIISITAKSKGIESHVLTIQSEVANNPFPILPALEYNQNKLVEVGPRDAADGGI